MSQIASLPSNVSSLFAATTTTNSIVNFASEKKELPRWLLEFDGFTTREDSDRSKAAKTDQHSSSKQQQPTRPLTESHLHNRPKWFEELTGRRRLSDIAAGMDTDETEHFSSEALFLNQEPVAAKTSNNISLIDLPTAQPAVDLESKLPTERKYSSSEWLFLGDSGPSSYSTAKNASGNSSRDGSLVHSPLTHLNSSSTYQREEEDIFSLSNSTSTRSIEKSLRISSEQPPEECIIPEMPRGSELTLTLLANWGDDSFIGLNGIEIFDPLGKRSVVKNIYLVDSAEKRHQLADLRKLVDSVVRTHDDNHIWQFRLGRREQTLPLSIVIQLAEPVTIALLRIWNYNKSRIHSYRGIKFVQIKLQSQLIFSGEIAKASGELCGSVENFGDTILFTTNEAILEKISHFDTSFQELLMEQFQQVPLKF